MIEPDEVELLGRCHAGEDLRRKHAFALPLAERGKGFELAPLDQDRCSRRGEPERLGDGSRGRGMIARDHHHLDARAPAVGDRLFHIDARRVAEPDEAEKIEALVGWNGVRRDRAFGKSEDTQSLLGERSSAPQPFVAVLPGDERSFLAKRSRGLKHALRRPLHSDEKVAIASMRRCHHLRLGIEGDLVQPRRGGEQGGALQPRKPAEPLQCKLHRVAHAAIT